jgi:hypothetical protein
MGQIQFVVQPADQVPAQGRTALLTGVSISGTDVPGGLTVAVGDSPGQKTGYYAGTAPALVAGASAAPISVPVVTSNSIVLFALRSAGASTAFGAQIKRVNLTPGTPGSFEIASFKADTTAETGDLSVYDWQLIEATQ